jgi:two-component system cell cycle sensor histidine kinase/response regulator CckA
MVDTVIRNIPTQQDDDFTGTINLDTLFARDVTSSGSFDLRGVRTTSLGKLLMALPMPALVVNRAHQIAFANLSWGETRGDSEQLCGRPFSYVFSWADRAARAHAVLEKAFSSRTTQVSEDMLNVGKNQVWGRMHLRSLRMARERFVLVLVEDLTLEKKQILMTRQHEEGLRAARDSLERRVAERTAQLLKTNQQLKEEIESRRRAEEQVGQSEELYRTLVEDSSDGIFMLKGSSIAFANARLHEMLGIGPGGLARRTLWEFCRPQSHEYLRQWTDNSIKGVGAPSECHTALVREDGSEFDVEMNARLVQFRGKPCVRVCVRDITDRKRAEELLVRTERLNAVSDLAGGVAHNFNNLLQIVTFAAQLGMTHIESGNPLQAIQSLQDVLESCRIGAQTIKRLQEFACVRHGRSKLGGRAFDVTKVVAAAIEMTRPWWKTNPEKEGITITLRKDLHSPCAVKGKESEMFEVAVNLIKNAAEALPGGGNIWVRTFAQGDRVAMEVEDDGCGIREENLARVFEPFTTTKGGHGTGMGLASSLGIVKRHNGEISLQSREGKGTKVTVTLPLTSEHPGASPAETGAKPTPGLRILVVDDMDQAAEMLAEGISGLGHKAFAATSGPEAIDIFERNEIDIVICDLGMPHMNGWQVGSRVKAICAERGVSKTPFILLTGWGGQLGEEERMAQCGIDRVVEKPAFLKNLMDVVSDLVNEHEVASA